MAITVKDISEKVFTRQVRGYSMDEVDNFLDELAQQVEALIQENRRLSQQLEEAKTAAPAAAPAQETPASQPEAKPVEDSQYFKNLETTMRETLLNAQRVADETLAGAKTKAEEMIAAAKEEADQITAGARGEVDTIRSANEAARKAAADYRAGFLRLVEDQMKVINSDEVKSLFE